MSSRNPLLALCRSLGPGLAAGLVVAGALVGGTPAQAAQGTLVSACRGSIGCANKINLRDRVNRLEFHGQITATSPIDFLDEPFGITLSNAKGVIFSETLGGGFIRKVDRRFLFRDGVTGKLGYTFKHPTGSLIFSSCSATRRRAGRSASAGSRSARRRPTPTAST